MDLNETLLTRNLALKLLTLLEDCQTTNARLRAYILSRSEAQQAGFSLEEHLREDALTADIEQDLRKLYRDLRALIAQWPHSSDMLSQTLRQIQELVVAGRLG